MKITRVLEHTVSVVIGLAIAGTAYVVAAPGDLVPVGRIIPYEGYVEIDGVPLNATRTMCFRLYDSASAASPFWQSGPMTVTVTQGVFAVNLGSGATRLTEQAFSTMSLHLGVELAAADTCSADGSAQLQGRQQLVNPWLAANGPAFISGTANVQNLSASGTLSVGGTATVGSLTAGSNVRTPQVDVTGWGINLGSGPRVVGGERHAGGIYWPENVFGGTGDGAHLMLLSGSSGEDQTLRLGVWNEPGDSVLIQSNASSLRVRGDGLETWGNVRVNNNQDVIGASTISGQLRANGGLAVTGNITGNSTSISSVTNVTATGTVQGANVTATSTVQGSTVRATSTMTTPSITVSGDLIATSNTRSSCSLGGAFADGGTQRLCPDGKFVAGIAINDGVFELTCCEL